MSTTYTIRIEITDKTGTAVLHQQIADPKDFADLLRGYADHVEGIAAEPSPTTAMAQRRLAHRGGKKP